MLKVTYIIETCPHLSLQLHHLVCHQNSQLIVSVGDRQTYIDIGYGRELRKKSAVGVC